MWEATAVHERPLIRARARARRGLIWVLRRLPGNRDLGHTSGAALHRPTAASTRASGSRWSREDVEDAGQPPPTVSQPLADSASPPQPGAAIAAPHGRACVPGSVDR